jgi:ketosteroid isomerase-like protein
MGHLDFEFVEFRKLSPEYYFVVGKWHLKRTIGDVGGSYTLLFRKIRGSWTIVVDHSS